MRLKRERAQSTMEYAILFGVLTAMVAGMLFAFSGGGFQDILENYIKGG